MRGCLDTDVGPGRSLALILHVRCLAMLFDVCSYGLMDSSAGKTHAGVPDKCYSECRTQDCAGSCSGEQFENSQIWPWTVYKSIEIINIYCAASY